MPIAAVNKFIRKCKAGNIGGSGTLGRRLWDRMKNPTCEKWAEAMVAVLEKSGVQFSKDQYLTDKQFAEILKFAPRIGEGQGAGKGKQGQGGRDMCYCPKCKKNFKHDRGEPCIEQSCPVCGSKMQPAKEGDSMAERKPDPGAKVRNRGKCALPAEHPKVNDNEDHYPINNVDRARNALARVAQQSSSPDWFDGTLEQLQSIVRGAVKKAYPSIKVSMSEDPNVSENAEPQTMRELELILSQKVNDRYGAKRDDSGAVTQGPDGFLVDVLISERAVIIRKSDGNLVQVDYDLDDDGEISLGDEMPVKHQYIPMYAEEIETVDIKGVELFMAGAKETPEFSVDDLDEMVAAAKKLDGEIKPPIFLGHTRHHGWPAFGWVSNLRRTGKKLVGDLMSVPQTVAKWIKSGGFRRVSSEIAKNYQSENGDKYKWVFYGLALLGQDIPKLKLLKDLPVPIFGELPDTEVFRFDKSELNKGGEKKMPEPVKEEKTVEVDAREYAELRDAKDKLRDQQELETQITELSEKIETLKGEKDDLQGKIDKAEEKFAEQAKAAKKAKIGSAIEQLIKDGRMSPAESEVETTFCERLDDAEVIEFGEGEDKISGTALDLHLKSLEGRPKNSHVDYSERSKTSKKGDREVVDSEEELHKRALEYAEEHKVSYRDALSAVSTEQDEEQFAEEIR